MTYNPFRQPPYGASQYEDRDRGRGRNQYRPHEADPKGRTPRAGRNTRRRSPSRGDDHPGPSRSNDGLYERMRRRIGRYSRVSRDMYAGVGGPAYGEFDDRFGQARAELNRDGREAGVNYHYDLPRTMPPPSGGGGFDDYAPGYNYPPDPRTTPRTPRDRSRSANGERPRKSRQRPKVSLLYVYVGTTDPDGKVIDGYEGYESEP
ncbi:hypothetical protein F5144DRAFT_492820 [Chaetomium tenue]|uniref:Uncharacterized protein n=1 Tax=Chaetomium tenue TaxID=1854479 RepID=A0ACB7P459_9PEZI|nr:hypothetical protein F5144DRAFT_492820 [Chaetomium globosum]